MENDLVTITLTVNQWNSMLGALSTAPFQVVNNISDAVNALQAQAAPQIEEHAKKYASEDAINPS